MLTVSAMLLLCTCHTVFGQTNWTKYDAIVDLTANDVEELSNKITQNYETPKEKVEALYYWVARNIAYDHRLLEKRMNDAKKPKRYRQAEIQEKIAGEVSYSLKRKKGICQNYAYTFQALCRQINIPCEFIGGWSRTNPENTNSIGGRHAWNR